MINELKYNYSERPLFVPPREQVQAFIIDCFRSLNDLKRLPAKSFREYLEMNSFEKINSDLIRDVLSAVWSRCIGPASKKEFFPGVIENVFLPALFSRNLILRTPTTQDSARINKKLSLGLVSNCYGILLEAPDALKVKQKSYGAIYYDFIENDKCRVVSLKVHQKKEGFKFGNLLLCSVYHQAKAMRCNQMLLCPTDEGIPLYLSFGFLPVDLVARKDELMEWWETLSFDVRIAITEELVCLMSFDMQNTNKIEQNLKKALNFFSENPVTHPFLKVDIPQEAYDFGLLKEDPDKTIDDSVYEEEEVGNPEDSFVTFMDSYALEE